MRNFVLNVDFFSVLEVRGVTQMGDACESRGKARSRSMIGGGCSIVLRNTFGDLSLSLSGKNLP